MADDDDGDVVYVVPTPPPAQVQRIALITGLVAVVVLAALVGWLGFRSYESEHRDAQRGRFVEAAQDVAINLSSVDYEHVDADAQRIQDSAIGTFATASLTTSSPTSTRPSSRGPGRWARSPIPAWNRKAAIRAGCWSR
jgi:hypothetical protein